MDCGVRGDVSVGAGVDFERGGDVLASEERGVD